MEEETIKMMADLRKDAEAWHAAVAKVYRSAMEFMHHELVGHEEVILNRSVIVRDVTSGLSLRVDGVRKGEYGLIEYRQRGGEWTGALLMDDPHACTSVALSLAETLEGI